MSKFIKATHEHNKSVIYFNVNKIISIEPAEYKEAKSLVKCDVDTNKQWHYVLETPENLLEQIERKKISSCTYQCL